MVKILQKFKAKHWIMTSIIIAIIFVQVYVDLLMPEFIGSIAYEVQLVLIGSGKFANVWNEGVKMLMVAASSVTCSVCIGFLAAYLGADFAHTLRGLMYNRVQDFSANEINKFSTPSLITRTTNDIQQVSGVVIMFFRLAVSAPITAVSAIIKLLSRSTQLSAITAIAIIFIVALIVLILLLAMPKFTLMQKLTDKVNQLIRENLMGLKVVRAFNADQYQNEKFEKTNVRYGGTALFTNRVVSMLDPGILLTMNAISLAVVWYGGYLINGGAIKDISVITEFSSYSIQVLFSFVMLSMLFIIMPRASVSAKRINEVLSTQTSIVGGTFKGEMSAGQPVQKDIEVEFKNVSFKYPAAEENILTNISFKAKKGESIAFIGSTGSGKSTLINLLPRFYDVSEGEVLIDGVNVREYDTEYLNSKIGYVPQKGFLFDGTIRENMLIGKPDASDEEINSALSIAQAADFVSKLDDGLDYHIASSGKNVSGGQRQRLSIARAVIKDPEIYIFDDSFSALDYTTDRNLRAALKQSTKKSISFIVASRIGTIMDADLILVLEKGKVVGMGKHSELLKNCEVYQEIAYSQLSKEELENE